MEQTKDRKSRQNPLARQAELNTPIFRKLTLVGFGSLSDEVAASPVERYIRGIPLNNDYVVAGSFARNLPHRQADFALEAQRTMTIDSRMSDSEVVSPLASLADTYANNPFWDSPTHLMTASGSRATVVAQIAVAQNVENPLEKIVGIFKDEPLMETLMESVREDRRLEIETDVSE